MTLRNRWKTSPPDPAGERAAMALEDARAGRETWGNGCERRGCRAPSACWVEVDGIAHEVCASHAVEEAQP